MRAHGGGGSSPLTRGKREPRPQVLHGHGLIPAHAGKTASGRGPSVKPGAHPRSRGENNVAWHDPATPTGSSPLTRGKRRRPERGPRPGGLIPAHAGKTLVYWAAHQMGRAHPRSRGENQSFFDLAVNGNGSSPLTRGKLLSAIGGLTGGGLIPAHAGKTCAWRKRGWTCWAHPRSRGENPCS